jgi:hypothetical protein
MSSNCIQFKDKPEIPCDNIEFPTFDNLNSFESQSFNQFISKKFNSLNYKFDENYINNPTAQDNDFSVRQQQMFVSKYANFHNNFQGLLVYHGLGSGKCHGINTEILMYDGTIKLVQDIIEGDLLMGDDSTPRKVLKLGRGRETLYDVIADNGEKITCNSSHILSLKISSPYISSLKTINVTIKDFITQYPAKELYQDNKISSLERQNNNTIYKLYKNQIEFEKEITSITYNCYYTLGTKFIVGTDYPDIKITKLKSRQLWLAGVIDKYATLANNYYKLPFSDSFVTYIAGSIGIVVYKNNLIIASNKIPSKKFPISRLNDTGIINFELIERENNKYYGFTLDSNSLYVLGNHYVTHNTCTSILVGEAYKAFKGYRDLNKTNFSKDSRIIVVVPPSTLQQFKEEIYGKMLANGDLIGCTSNIKYEGKQVNYINKVIDTASIIETNKFISDLLKNNNNIPEKQSDDTNVTIRNRNMVKRQNDLNESEKNKIEIEVSKYWNIMTHIGFINSLVNRTDRNVLQDITKQLQRGESLVIIDEIQNLISESGILYNKLVNVIRLFSNNNRIIALSATPIYDKPYELGLTLNLLNPRLFFPSTQNEFNNMFYKSIVIPGEDKQIVNINMDLFYWMCNGYVSYFSGGNPRDFPFKRIIEKHHIMSANITSFYFKTLANEIKITSDNDSKENEQTKKEVTDQVNQTFLSKVRQYCNIVFPDDLKGNTTNTSKEKLINFKSKLVALKNNFMKPGIENWEIKLLAFISENYSSKMADVAKSIMEDPGTHLVFSDLRTYGVEALGIILEVLEFNKVEASDVKTKLTLNSFNESFNKKNKKNNNPSALRYTIWSGEISGSDKNMYSSNIREIFNDTKNSKGEYLKVILGTTSIMEGVSFKNVKNVHILNPWWNESRIQQVIARAIRFKSHHSLPENERFVNVYRHYSVFSGFPGSNSKDGEIAIGGNIRNNENIKAKITEINKRGLFTVTIDQHMGNRAAAKKLQSIDFEQSLKASAVDCNINKYANLTRLEENIKPRYIQSHRNNTFERSDNTLEYVNPSTGIHYKKMNEVNLTEDVISEEQVKNLKLSITSFGGDIKLVSCSKVHPPVRSVTASNISGSISGYFIFVPNGNIILDTHSANDMLKITNDFIINENIKCVRDKYYEPTKDTIENKTSKDVVEKLKIQTMHMKENSKVIVDELYPKDSKFITTATEELLKKSLINILKKNPKLKTKFKSDLGLLDEDQKNANKDKNDKIKKLISSQIRGYSKDMDIYVIGDDVLTDEVMNKIISANTKPSSKSSSKSVIINADRYRSIVSDAQQLYSLLSGFSTSNIDQLLTMENTPNENSQIKKNRG